MAINIISATVIPDAVKCDTAVQVTHTAFQFWGSLVLFIMVLTALFLRRRISPAVTVIVGMFLALIMGLTDLDKAASTIDLNALFLVASMMISTAILTESGFFEWVVIVMAKFFRGNAFLILFMLLTTSMIFSAFLDNIAVMIIMIPLAIVIGKVLELPVRTILVFVLVAANLGGAASLLGAPQNMILGAKTDLTFDDFILNAAPCVLGIGVVFILVATLLLSNSLSAPPSVRTKVEDFYPRGAIINHGRMRSAFIIFFLMIIAFALQPVIKIEPGVTAMLGMAVMLTVYRPDAKHLMRYLDWELIVMIVGLFILAGTVAQNGVIEALANLIYFLGGDNIFAICMIVLWGSALLSSVIDSIPLTLIIVPIAVKHLIPTLGLASDGSNPLFWAILFGISLGGCGTLFGTPASMMTYRLAQANGYTIPVRHFFYWGFPFMILQLGLCSLYLWYRFF